MSLFVHSRWLQRAIVGAIATLGFCAATPLTKPAEAAFVSVGVGIRRPRMQPLTMLLLGSSQPAGVGAAHVGAADLFSMMAASLSVTAAFSAMVGFSVTAAFFVTAAFSAPALVVPALPAAALADPA